jgi:hypothetical protein
VFRSLDSDVKALLYKEICVMTVVMLMLLRDFLPCVLILINVCCNCCHGSINKGVKGFWVLRDIFMTLCVFITLDFPSFLTGNLLVQNIIVIIAM